MTKRKTPEPAQVPVPASRQQVPEKRQAAIQAALKSAIRAAPKAAVQVAVAAAQVAAAQPPQLLLRPPQAKPNRAAKVDKIIINIKKRTVRKGCTLKDSKKEARNFRASF